MTAECLNPRQGRSLIAPSLSGLLASGPNACFGWIHGRTSKRSLVLFSCWLPASGGFTIHARHTRGVRSLLSSSASLGDTESKVQVAVSLYMACLVHAEELWCTHRPPAHGHPVWYYYE